MCTDARLGWWSSPHHIYGLSSKAYRVAEFGLRERACGHHILRYIVATLSRGLPRGCHSDNRSLTIDPFDGAASFVPDAVTLDWAWIISVHLAKDGIPTGAKPTLLPILFYGVGPILQNPRYLLTKSNNWTKVQKNSVTRLLQWLVQSELMSQSSWRLRTSNRLIQY